MMAIIVDMHRATTYIHIIETQTTWMTNMNNEFAIIAIAIATCGFAFTYAMCAFNFMSF